MPRTRHFGGGPTGRAVRWLVAALVVPVLAACGGGSGNNGQNGSGQATSPQPDDQRTKARETQASFQEAGAVSATARGRGTRAVVTLRSSSPKPVEAVVSDVTDCTHNAEHATPSQATVTVTADGSEPLDFTLPTSSGTTRPICYTVAIGGESRELKAEGEVTGTASPSPGVPTTGKTGPTGGSTSPGGSGTPYRSNGGTGTGTGSTP
ncbi:hypothetical protein [Kitasatospora sp. NPDC096204]|uniref:hypothetical protein n=1 Tax=Kitasatospora sp. NPDC096204 TaxID=3364094 RepID=UPI0037F3F690